MEVQIITTGCLSLPQRSEEEAIKHCIGSAERTAAAGVEEVRTEAPSRRRYERRSGKIVSDRVRIAAPCDGAAQGFDGIWIISAARSAASRNSGRTVL